MPGETMTFFSPRATTGETQRQKRGAFRKGAHLGGGASFVGLSKCWLNTWWSFSARKPGVKRPPFKRYLRLNMVTTLREFLDETAGRCSQQLKQHELCVGITWSQSYPSWELSHIPIQSPAFLSSMVFLFPRVPWALEGIVWVVPSPSNSGKYEGLGQDPRHLNIYVILVVTRYLVPSYSFLSVRRSVATWRKNLFFCRGNCISKVLSVFEVYKWKRMPFFKCRVAT